VPISTEFTAGQASPTGQTSRSEWARARRTACSRDRAASSIETRVHRPRSAAYVCGVVILRRRHVVAPAAAALLTVLAGCGFVSVHRTAVASVAGCGSVTKTELDHWTGVELATHDRMKSARAARVAMNLLIAWVCLTSEADRSHVVVNAAEAVNQIALSQAADSEGVAIEWLPDERAIKPFLKSPRVSRGDQIILIKMAVTSVRVQSKETALLEPRVTRGAILHYYRQHPSSFESTERRDIRAVMNRSEAKDLEAKKEMQTGVPFRLIERRFNQSPEGGLHIGRGRGRQAAPWERDYFSAPPHVLVGPRKEVYYYVFEVFHIRPPHERPLSDVEAGIRHLLARSQVSRRAKAREASWRNRATCVTRYVGDRCGRYAPAVAS
jgi:hypothetical protein